VVETLFEYELEDVEALEELEGDLADADLAEIIPNATDEGLHLFDQEIEELESFVDELAEIDKDPKIGQLIDDLDELDREGHNRAIVFTQYTDTMDFIRQSLVSTHGETVATYSGRGGEMYERDSGSWISVGKERVKREFAAEDGSVDILVCTDSASEGLNLQECGALINYELPWNPMRVEQRIGRIDRIGQRYDEVTILNYSYDDTVETDIYDRLDARIGLFENVVGDMQPILSGLSSQIRTATLETDRSESPDALERADQEISDRIREQKESEGVDVRESLVRIAEPIAQDVIEEARLDAWGSFKHPDLPEIGSNEYGTEIPYTVRSLESVLTASEALKESGIRFMSVSDLALDKTHTEFGNGFDFEKSTYQLEVNDAELIPNLDTEETLASVIAPDKNTVAVTFSDECADEFPSLHFLAPGNPFLDHLIDVWRENTDDSHRLNRYAKPNLESAHQIICGWGKSSSISIVADDGAVKDATTLSELSDWYSDFVSNREKLLTD